jgi:hypothetical protein
MSSLLLVEIVLNSFNNIFECSLLSPRPEKGKRQVSMLSTLTCRSCAVAVLVTVVQRVARWGPQQLRAVKRLSVLSGCSHLSTNTLQQFDATVSETGSQACQHCKPHRGVCLWFLLCHRVDKNTASKSMYPLIKIACIMTPCNVWPRGLVVRVPGYTTEMYGDSCEVRTEFIYVM